MDDYRQAKWRIAQEEEQARGADLARTRFMRRNQRLEREQAAAAAAEAANGAATERPGPGQADKKAYVQAAIARGKAKRQNRRAGTEDRAEERTDD